MAGGKCSHRHTYLVAYPLFMLPAAYSFMKAVCTATRKAMNSASLVVELAAELAAELDGSGIDPPQPESHYNRI